MQIRTFGEKTDLSVIILLISIFLMIAVPGTAANGTHEHENVVSHTEKIKPDLNGNSNRKVMIASGHPNYPPFMWKQGNTIIGVGAELVKVVCSELAIPLEIKWSGPWKRLQKNALEGNVDLVVGIYSNDERREYLDYTIPYMTDPTSITVLKENAFSYQKRSDLIGKVGITMHGDSFGQEFDDYIRTELKIERAYAAEALFKNLLAGRAEYILWGYYPVSVNASRLGFKDKIRIVSPAVITENMYMAFSKKSGFRKNLNQVNLIIKRLKKNGTIQRWVDQYLAIYNTESVLPSDGETR